MTVCRPRTTVGWKGLINGMFCSQLPTHTPSKPVGHRPGHERLLPNQQRSSNGSKTASRPRKDGLTDRMRIPRYDLSSVHRGSYVLGCNRSENDGESGSQGVDECSEYASRIQSKSEAASYFFMDSDITLNAELDGRERGYCCRRMSRCSRRTLFPLRWKGRLEQYRRNGGEDPNLRAL